MNGPIPVPLEVVLGREPLDVARLAAARVPDPNHGAVVHFHGVVRGTEGGVPIWGLDYSAHEKMARRQFGLLVGSAAARWPVAAVRIHHRLGPVRAGEASLWVEVVASHRTEAFAACQGIIDEMKRVVPIWKRVVPLDRPATG